VGYLKWQELNLLDFFSFAALINQSQGSSPGGGG